MRSSWRAGVLPIALILASGAARAQQPPTYGCHASTNCQPLGFSTLRNDTFGIGGGALFGIGFKWDPGFVFFIAGPHEILLAPKPTPVDGELFHLRLSILAPTIPPFPAMPPPATLPTPTPLPAPPAD
jgi:hypothetical protein